MPKLGGLISPNLLRMRLENQSLARPAGAEGVLSSAHSIWENPWLVRCGIRSLGPSILVLFV